MTDEQQRQLELLQKLSLMEEFKLWRDLAAKPIIDQLKGELSKPMELSEANLKAKVLHLNTMEALFYNIFNEASLQLKLDRDNSNEPQKGRK